MRISKKEQKFIEVIGKNKLYTIDVCEGWWPFKPDVISKIWNVWQDLSKEQRKDGIYLRIKAPPSPSSQKFITQGIEKVVSQGVKILDYIITVVFEDDKD